MAVADAPDVNDYMLSRGVQSAYFGLSDAGHEGDWRWATGEPLSWYSNWHSGEPNNERGAENYAMFYYKFTDGTWNDGDFGAGTANAGRTFFCEWPAAEGFRFTADSAVRCVPKGGTIELYDGYYENGALRRGSCRAWLDDESVFALDHHGWDSAFGTHLTLTAKKTGTAQLTVEDERSGETASLTRTVLPSESVWSFDAVPKQTVEDGKTTNFYDFSGLVVDDFSYRRVKTADGSTAYYELTMNIYNTLDLYGAVCAYDADGSLYDYRIIDRFTSMDSSFVDSLTSLVRETGDLFYLLGNSRYYSGESISKKTAIGADKPLRVPAGGYVEISNSALCPAALFANTAGLLLDYAATVGSLAGGAAAEKEGNPFADVASGAYYAPAVRWAVENGITSGTGTDRFSPDAPCARGQIVTFLYRAGV